ncbi:L,D-transpeptidase family protein [Edaphobacter flagellatus]|uniref:L,D-transpeptidase family protein n=1 Tax=Edaphobacter flagellatus TaxID=1933044 RepID=UPI0021B27782|nr:L,D-transpeptidase family protein [Edaphobacter flagellatus]
MTSSLHPTKSTQRCIHLALFLSALLPFTAGCTKATGHAQVPAPRPVQNGKIEPIPQTAPSSSPAQVSSAFGDRIREIIAAGKFESMQQPNFTDYKEHLATIYRNSGYTPLWLRSDGISPEGKGIIEALEASEQKGLSPADYDATRWSARLDALKGASDAQKAEFDVVLTVTAMRYVSDLHIGRVNPKHFKFGIDAAAKKYDLPQFFAQQLLNAADVKNALDKIEPPFDGYRQTEAAFVHYQKLAAAGDGPAVPQVSKTIKPGDDYPGVPQLVARLRLLGDMPAGGELDNYDAAVAEGVKHFQMRHGLTPDGTLTAATVRALNVPLLSRVRQLADALERWRWMPPEFPQPPVVVNIPEFRLRAFEPEQKVGLAMNVVVGKAAPTQTPVFTDDIQYIIFRPYWYVPRSIVRSSVIPGINRSGRAYLSKENFEIVGAPAGASTADLVAGLRSGKYGARQKPGPKNSLGLIKFIFPNSNNVYLHSTPAVQLFSQSRRDFSHGCIRLEHPAELASFLLRNQDGGKWTTEAVQKAMDAGPDNRQVNLVTEIPVLLLYVTAVPDEDGTVHFFDDIYGHDKKLDAVLAKGPPYPW